MIKLDDKHKALYDFFTTYLEYNFSLLRIKYIFENNENKLEKQKMIVNTLKSHFSKLDEFAQDLMKQEADEINQILKDLQVSREDFKRREEDISTEFNSETHPEPPPEPEENSDLSLKFNGICFGAYLKNHIISKDVDKNIYEYLLTPQNYKN